MNNILDSLDFSFRLMPHRPKAVLESLETKGYFIEAYTLNKNDVSPGFIDTYVFSDANEDGISERLTIEGL